MSELRDPQARERPTEPDGAAHAESAVHTPRNAADVRDTVVTEPLAPEPRPEAERRSTTGIGRKPPGETTLVSVPTPADQADLEIEDRLTEMDRKIYGLEERLRVLESKNPASSEPSWLVWVVFLLALAVAWQLIQGRG